MPVQEGNPYRDSLKGVLRKFISDAIGKEVTDVAAVCCDEKGNHLLFVGLPGRSYKKFVYNPEPRGTERLSPAIVELYARLDHALEAAVRKGNGAAEEDDSNGYALIKDPAARSLQLAVREWAIKHNRELLDVLLLCSFVEHRRIASDALGYVWQSPEQLSALLHAARDPDREVRNNATRALGVLARSQPSVASQIPPQTFVEMLNSGLWTDRNKATSLLVQLTLTRSPDLLAKIRSESFDSVLEMATWREPAHASYCVGQPWLSRTRRKPAVFSETAGK